MSGKKRCLLPREGLTAQRYEKEMITKNLFNDICFISARKHINVWQILIFPKQNILIISAFSLLSLSW